MIVYEKENKLNIKFDGNLDENTIPDFSLYKNGEDKVVIDANGQQSEPGTGGGQASPDDAGKTVIIGNDGNYTLRFDFMTKNPGIVEVVPETEFTAEEHGHGDIYATISYNKPSFPSIISVIYDGQKYDNIVVHISNNTPFWGAIMGEYDVYPFCITTGIDYLRIFTEAAGTHTIQISSDPSHQQINTVQNVTTQKEEETDSYASAELSTWYDFLPAIVDIEFNGVLYNNVQGYVFGGSGTYYGDFTEENGPTFSKYPFSIVGGEGGVYLYTEEPEECSIRIIGSSVRPIIGTEFRNAILEILSGL